MVQIWPLLILSPFLAFSGQLRGETQGEATPYGPGIEMAVAGNYEGALQFFQNLLEEKPDDPTRNYYVGLCHLYLRDAEKAALYLRKAAERKAPFPEAYYWLAHSLLARDRNGEALAVLVTGMREFPESRKLKSLAAEVRASLGLGP